MIDLDDMVAEPGRRPLRHQASAPVLGPKPAVTNSPDLQRIIELPRRAPLEIGSPESLALCTRVSSKLRKPPGPCRCREDFNRDCILSLREIQAQALWEIYKVGGMLGAIAVGAGKTIINLLAPMVLRDCKTALLLVPSTLTEQLVRDYRLLAQHWRVPSLVMQTRNGWSDILPNTPTLHVLPYSLLQRPDFTAWIAGLKPDVIIADEADKLRGFGDRQTATSSRVWRAFADAPGTRFIPSSGSLTEAKLDDYAHLAMIALGDGSPLPHDREVVKEWGGAIDADVGCPAHPGALLELGEPGEEVRAAFHRRLVDTAGVIRTESSGVDGVGLEILDREVRAPQVIESALADLRATWVRPDGEELVDAMQVKRCAREIASGFHYYWFFERGEPRELVDDWLEARKEWHCELRDKLKDRVEHLDSPLLCARAARRAWGDEPITNGANEVELEAEEFDHDEEEVRFWDHDRQGLVERITKRKRKRVQGNAHLPTWKADAWPRWRDIRDKVQPTTRTQRIDDYLVCDAAAWAESHRGIVWYEHSAFGEWLAELSGLTMHGGGPGAGERLAAEDGARSIICSIKSHGRGRDGLQRLFWEQLVANPMTGASAWEQLLGRLHRIGQAHPMVTAWVYRHTLEMREAVDKAKARGEYITGTLGAAQKLTGALR